MYTHTNLKKKTEINTHAPYTQTHQHHTHMYIHISTETNSKFLGYVHLFFPFKSFHKDFNTIYSYRMCLCFFTAENGIQRLG